MNQVVAVVIFAGKWVFQQPRWTTANRSVVARHDVTSNGQTNGCFLANWGGGADRLDLADLTLANDCTRPTAVITDRPLLGDSTCG